MDTSTNTTDVEPARSADGPAESPATDARVRIIGYFSDFVSQSGGIDSWLTARSPDVVFERLDRLGEEPLTQAQLTQLLVRSHEAGVSQAFYSYYWLEAPATHPYDVKAIEGFEPAWLEAEAIVSLPHLRWGLHRFYQDALLFFGNVRSAYRRLRDLDHQTLAEFFSGHCFDTRALGRRGAPLPLKAISKDDRYLVAEMACKSLDAVDGSSDLGDALRDAYREHMRLAGGPTSIRALLDGKYVADNYGDRQQQLMFAADDLLEQDIEDAEELEGKIATVTQKFDQARAAALENTNLYLSMIEGLDAYVATSMRKREDFRGIATFCDEVFQDERLRELSVRYFDPTMSAAAGHEDKGLIECLMVKCTKLLVYVAGEKESWGKDAEAAMALSLGKPVIFFCKEEPRQKLYRDIHPLSRLIDFDTGVAVGAIIADTEEDVSELIYRILTNRMEYVIEQPRPGFLRLKERLTGSVVRLQTNDALLRETFWNYYHRAPLSPLA